MKKLILSVVAALLTVMSLSSVATLSPAAYADSGSGSGSKQSTAGTSGKYYCISKGEFVASIADCTKDGEGDGLNKEGEGNNQNNLMSVLNTVINVIIGIVGLIAVIMMIIGGISFITSQGDSNKVTKARNTILYGVVGLVVAILAFAIVNFVLSSVFKTADATSVWLWPKF